MNSKLSKLAIGLAAVCAFSGQAMAGTTTYNKGLLAVPSSMGFYDAEIATGLFTDNWTFSIAPNASFSSSITTATLGSYFNIDGLTASLFKTTGFNSVTPSGPALENSNNFSIPNVITADLLAPITLAAGNYNMQITGNVTGTSGGTYGGGLNLSPVPEPSEGALLISGIGMLGFLVARRKIV